MEITNCGAVIDDEISYDIILNEVPEVTIAGTTVVIFVIFIVVFVTL